MADGNRRQRLSDCNSLPLVVVGVVGTGGSRLGGWNRSRRPLQRSALGQWTGYRIRPALPTTANLALSTTACATQAWVGMLVSSTINHSSHTTLVDVMCCLRSPLASLSSEHTPPTTSCAHYRRHCGSPFDDTTADTDIRTALTHTQHNDDALAAHSPAVPCAPFHRNHRYPSLSKP